MSEYQYGSLREKIAAEKTARLQRYAQYDALWQRALEAGRIAAAASVPTPMHVVSGTGRHIETVNDGVCGFAWINFPGNTSFARWAAKSLARKDHSGGMTIWIAEYNQSMTRKEAFAQAAADVLREAGIAAYSHSRMD